MYLLAALAGAAACRPTLDDRPWLVDRLRIVGWTAEPPEAPPGSDVTFAVVALDSAGPPETAATAWSLCHVPRALDDEGPVAPACLAHAAADARGDPVRLRIPADACRTFGPDVPQPAPGAPPARPGDPDVTGGYYQPLTIALGSTLAVGLARLRCDLPDASLQVGLAFRDAYHSNQSPTIAGLAFSVGGAPVDLAAIPAGARVTIVVTWPAGTAESFPVFDRGAGALVDTREALFAAWYVTGGELDRAAAEIDDPAVTAAASTWTAPDAAATFEVVVTLRDSRGGAAAARATLGVVAAP